MRIARVFVRKTNMCPTDRDCYFGEPQMFMPKYDEIHISVTFTWDKDRGKYLKHQWGTVCNNVKIGGVVYGESRSKFVSGMYLKQGVVITSRGCNNNCKWCLVDHPLKEINIEKGNIIQDNNFLQCSKNHRQEVYDMLKDQKAIEFKGGLQSNLLTEWDVNELRKLKIKELWFACDTNRSLFYLRKAEIKLRSYFNRNKLRCYVLIGKDWNEENYRLRQVYKMRFLPFAQLHQPADKLINYSSVWKNLARQWSRPAIYKNIMIREGLC